MEPRPLTPRPMVDTWQVMEDQDRRNEASLATIAEREAAISQLSAQLAALSESNEELCRDLEQQQKQAAQIQVSPKLALAQAAPGPRPGRPWTLPRPPLDLPDLS